METAPEIRSYFWLEGESLNPEEFTRLIGVMPTKSGKRGDPLAHALPQKQGKTIPKTFWEISLKRKSYSTDEVIQELLDPIWKHRDAIVEYLKAKVTVKTGVLIAITIYKDRPVYELSPETIKKLADLGCGFGMDDILDHRMG